MRILQELTSSETTVHPIAEWKAHDDFLCLRHLRHGCHLTHIIVTPSQRSLLLRPHLLRQLLLLLRLFIFAVTLGRVLDTTRPTTTGTTVAGDTHSFHRHS